MIGPERGAQTDSPGAIGLEIRSDWTKKGVQTGPGQLDPGGGRGRGSNERAGRPGPGLLEDDIVDLLCFEGGRAPLTVAQKEAVEATQKAIADLANVTSLRCEHKACSYKSYSSRHHFSRLLSVLVEHFSCVRPRNSKASGDNHLQTAALQAASIRGALQNLLAAMVLPFAQVSCFMVLLSCGESRRRGWAGRSFIWGLLATVEATSL